MRNLEKRIEQLEQAASFTETNPARMSDQQLILIATGARRAPGDVSDAELAAIAKGVSAA